MVGVKHDRISRWLSFMLRSILMETEKTVDDKKDMKSGRLLLSVRRRSKRISPLKFIYAGIMVMVLLTWLMYIRIETFGSNLVESDELESRLNFASNLKSTSSYPGLDWKDLKPLVQAASFNATRRRKKIFNSNLKLKRFRSSKARSFGCLREGCRGLAIEDLLDRGWKMKFRSGYKNMTRLESKVKEFKDLKFSASLYLTDTTTLNQLKEMKQTIFEKIISSERYVSALFGAEAIGGNKGKQLRTKANYVRKFARRTNDMSCNYNSLGVQPLQLRLYVKEECDLFMKLGNVRQWMLKPEEGSQGKGITLHNNLISVAQTLESRSEDVSFFPCDDQLEIPARKRYLVQEYIANPLLLKGCKFDLRVYLLIARTKPFFLFFHEGYLRRALTPYSPHSKNRKSFLTNTHFQSMRPDFKLSDHIWSFKTFQEYLCKEHKLKISCYYVDAVLVPYLKEVALFVYFSARKKMQPNARFGTFHVFGLDFMIDENLAVHFLEANGYPGFTWSINFDSRQMVEQMFDLIVELHEAPFAVNKLHPGDRYGQWNMVYNELYSKQIGYTYNPCAEFKKNIELFKPIVPSMVRLNTKRNSKRKSNSIANMINNVTVPHWELLGGEKGETLDARVNFVRQASGGKCDYWDLELEPRTYKLYEKAECEKFLAQPVLQSSNSKYPNSESWLLKQVQGQGQAEGLIFFANRNDVGEQFKPCKNMHPNWLAQKYIVSSYRFNVGELQSIRVKDIESWKDLLEEDETQVVYSLRVYMFVSSASPLLIWYHDGYMRSTRRIRNPQYDSIALDEHLFSFEDLNFFLASNQMAGPHYLTTVLRPQLQRRLEFLGQMYFYYLKANVSKVDIDKKNQMFAVNFVLGQDLKLHLVGISGNSSHKGFVPDQARKLLQDMEREAHELQFESEVSTAVFLRMKKGDSFGNFRLLVSEIEQLRTKDIYNPCDDFISNDLKTQTNATQLKQIANLQHFRKKQHASHLREMNKYVLKRWSYCKRKRSKDSQADCIRPTIEKRYEIYVSKERISKDDHYIENRIRQLQGFGSTFPNWNLT